MKPGMNNATRTLIAIIIVAAAAAGLFFWQLTKPGTAGTTVGENVIEIFYLPHAPALAIVQKVDPIIAKFPSYSVTKYDFEDPAGAQKISQYDLITHAPIVIFIGGKNSFVVDGRTVSLVNFPQGDAFVPSYEGGWTYGDLERILADQQYP